MKPFLIVVFMFIATVTVAQVPKNYPANYASAPRFKALLYFSERTENAHIAFAKQTVAYLQKLAVGDGFIPDSSLTKSERL